MPTKGSLFVAKQISIWIQDEMDEQPVIKIGTHTGSADPEQKKLVSYRAVDTHPSDDAARILRNFRDEIERQPFCESRSANTFKLANQAAIASLRELADTFLAKWGYVKAA
jgi:hypothetical protein